MTILVGMKLLGHTTVIAPNFIFISCRKAFNQGLQGRLKELVYQENLLKGKVPHPVQGVNIDKVYNLLLEELNQLLVNLVQQLGVFARQLLQALSEHQDQLLGLRILHWDFDCLLAPHLDGGEAIHPKGGNSGLLEDFRDFCVEDEPILRVFGGDLR